MQNQRGLTLLEVLVSMFVLATGLLGLAPMVTLSITENVMSRDVQTASSLARDKMEFYRGLDTLPVLPFSATESIIRKGDSSLFAISTVISDSTVDTLLSNGLNKLEVSISWTDDIGMSRSSIYTTYLQGK